MRCQGELFLPFCVWVYVFLNYKFQLLSLKKDRADEVSQGIWASTTLSFPHTLLSLRNDLKLPGEAQKHFLLSKCPRWMVGQVRQKQRSHLHWPCLVLAVVIRLRLNTIFVLIQTNNPHLNGLFFEYFAHQTIILKEDAFVALFCGMPRHSAESAYLKWHAYKWHAYLKWQCSQT